MLGILFALDMFNHIKQLEDLERLKRLKEKLADEEYCRTHTPEEVTTYFEEKKVERRHRELCDAIENAGRNARPRGRFFLGSGSFK